MASLADIATTLLECLGNAIKRAEDNRTCDILQFTLTAEGFEKVDQKCLERYHVELAALSNSFEKLPTTRQLAGALHIVDDRRGHRLTAHLFESSSKLAFYKYEMEKMRQMYTYCARMMRRNCFTRSVGMSFLRREWNDRAAVHEDSPPQDSPQSPLAIQPPQSPLAIQSPQSPLAIEEAGAGEVDLSAGIAAAEEAVSVTCDSPLPDYPATDPISVSEDEDEQAPYPSAGSAADEEVDLTVDVKAQRKTSKKPAAMKKPAASLKKRPAAFAEPPAKKASAPAPPAKKASAPGPVEADLATGGAAAPPGDARRQHSKSEDHHHVERSALRLVRKAERGKQFWVIKYEAHQLMQVTAMQAGSMDKAEQVAAFLIDMFYSCSLGDVKEARRRLLKGEDLFFEGLNVTVDTVDTAKQIKRRVANLDAD